MKTFITLIAIAFISLNINAQQLISNAGFENDFTNWQTNTGGTSAGTYTVGTVGSFEGSKHMEFEATILGGNAWDLQALSSTATVAIGTQYTISVYAKGKVGGESVSLVYQSLNGVQPSDYVKEDVTLTTSWVKYSFTYTPLNTTEGKVKLQFHTVGTYYIDDVNFNESGATAIDDVVGNSNIAVYPNPFDNQITIDSKESFKSVSIYNVTGQLVYSNTKLMNTKTINGLGELAKGVYFLKATSISGEIFTQKLMKE